MTAQPSLLDHDVATLEQLADASAASIKYFLGLLPADWPRAWVDEDAKVWADLCEEIQYYTRFRHVAEKAVLSAADANGHIEPTSRTGWEMVRRGLLNVWFGDGKTLGFTLRPVGKLLAEGRVSFTCRHSLWRAVIDGVECPVSRCSLLELVRFIDLYLHGHLRVELQDLDSAFFSRGDLT